MIRWPALGIFAAFSILFLWRRGTVRARNRAKGYIYKHLGSSKSDRGGFFAATRFIRLSEALKSSKALLRLRHSFENSGIETKWDNIPALWLWLVVASPTLAVAFFGSITAAFPAFAGALILPIPALSLVERIKNRNLSEQLERLAGDLTLYIQCGIPTLKAIDFIATDYGPPVAEYLDYLQKELAVGVTPDKALMKFASKCGDSDLVLIAQTLKTSRETGSDISRIMESIGVTIRERAEVKRELRTQTVQGKMSGQMVAALPLFFLAVTSVISKGLLKTLFTTVPGLLMLGTALILDVAGFKWINKILDIKI